MQAPRAPQRLSTRSYLLGLIAAVAIPVMAFSGFLVARYAIDEQERFDREAAQIAQNVAMVIDGELEQLIALLRALSASTALRQGELETFHAEASRLVGGQDQVVVLRSYHPVQILNTQVPFGTPLPPAVPLQPEEIAAFETGSPVVGKVYMSPISGEPRIAVALPVAPNGGTEYILAVTIPTASIRDTLVAAVPAGWIVGVGDSTGAYVARSQQHEEFSGRPGLPEYLAKATGRSGTFTSVNFAGVELLAGYVWSDFSGWFYAANTPLATVQAPLWRSLAGIGAAGLLALGVSAVLAFRFARGFTTTARGLEERATALGEGRPVTPLPTRFAEFAVVADALTLAATSVEERARERRRALEREALLSSIFDAAGLHVGVFEVHGDDVLFVVANREAASVLSRDTIEGLGGRDLALSETEIAFWRGVAARLDSEPGPLTLEYGLSRLGAEHWYLGTFSRLPASGTDRQRVAFTALDITGRKRTEEQRLLLVNELNHRVKNTLATVQSIAMQTLSGTTTVAEARRSLTDRLMALAKAHDVLTRESWSGADLREVVANAIEPHAGPERFELGGPPVRLTPTLSLTLALAIHELATNAVKYGALSVPAGTVGLTWTVDEPAHFLELRWQERNGPPVHPPQREGFGSRLLRRLFVTQDQGHASIDYPPGGVLCIMRAPLNAASAGTEQLTVA